MTRRRLTRAESQAQTRERLLEAARRSFARHGYDGASIDAIAEEAGYSKGAIYSNFHGKEELFLELMRQHMADEVRDIDAVLTELSGSKAKPDKVTSTLMVWLQNLNTDADWSMLGVELLLHARRNPTFTTKYDALDAQHRATLGVLIARLFAAMDKALPAEAEVIASAMMALAHGLALRRTKPLSRGGGDPAGTLMQLVLQSLIAVAPERGKAR